MLEYREPSFIGEEYIMFWPTDLANVFNSVTTSSNKDLSYTNYYVHVWFYH